MEDAVQPVCHGSLGLQALAVVVNGFYTMWKFARDALEILLQQMTGYETPVAGWCPEANPWDMRGVLGLQRMACQPLGSCDLSFAASVGLQFLGVAQRNIQPICRPLFCAPAASFCSSACSMALCSAYSNAPLTLSLPSYSSPFRFYLVFASSVVCAVHSL